MKNSPRKLIIATLLSSAALTVSTASLAADQALGLGLVSHGLGVTYTTKTDWQLRADDQIQLRFSIGGIDANDLDDGDFNNIEYENGDLSTFGVQGGVDWYPFNGAGRNIFFSTGLLYGDIDYKGQAKSNQSIDIGGTTINTNDINSLSSEFDNKSVAPYLSLGWGNRLGNDKGFGFQGELGFFSNLSDTNVKLTIDDPDNLISAAALTAERNQMEDELNGVNGFLSASVFYRF